MHYRKQPVKARITTPARTFGTEYQNLTGRPLLIIVTAYCYRGAVNENALFSGYVGDASPPTIIPSVGGFRAVALADIDYGYWTVIFAVPNEWYYKVTTNIGATSTVTLSEWTEVEL